MNIKESVVSNISSFLNVEMISSLRSKITEKR